MSDINELVEAEVLRRLADPAYLRETNLRLTEELQKRDEEIAVKDRAIEALVPIKDFYDRVAESDDWIDMAAAVKTLGYKGYGRNTVLSLLRDRQVLRYNNEPYQAYVDRGYFKRVEKPYTDYYGRDDISYKTVVSQKGLNFIRKIIEEDMAA